MMYPNSKKYFFCFILVFLFGLQQVLAQISFQDISAASGIDNTGTNRGVAISDFDNDGDDDIYLSIHDGPNKLYRKNSNGTYTDVAMAAGVAYPGVTHASIWGDFDNDGHLDLYIGNREESNVLYHNNGDGTFSDITASAGVGRISKPRSVHVADIDNDGFLDIYVANLWDNNALYRNNGNLTFTNIIMESGTSDPQLSMGAMFFDYDNDGDADLYLTHDGNQANKLFNNNGVGIFTDVSAISGTDYEGLGMGVDFGDINNDGWLDIYITNLGWNTLLLNKGDGTFEDISESAMVKDVGMGWGTTFLDYNNDGLQDIYAVNDSYFSPMPNVVYKNNGDNTFDLVSENSPLASMYGSYGTASTDINGDGLLDLFVTNNGMTDGNQLFQNQMTNTGNWFKIKTVGTISNRAAIGTRVTIEAGGKIFMDEVAGGTGYGSQNSLTLHFGLGDVELIDVLTIRWTNGLVETFENVDVNTTMLAIENESFTTGIHNLETPNFTIQTYPNPIAEELNILIENEQRQDFNIQIIDLTGNPIEKVFSGNLMAGSHTIQWVPNIPLPAGIYLISILSEQTKLCKKMFIKK